MQKPATHVATVRHCSLLCHDVVDDDTGDFISPHARNSSGRSSADIRSSFCEEEIFCVACRDAHPPYRVEHHITHSWHAISHGTSILGSGLDILVFPVAFGLTLALGLKAIEASPLALQRPLWRLVRIWVSCW